MITLKLRDIFTNNGEELLIREYPEDLVKIFIETQNIGLGVDNVFFMERFVVENPEVLDGLGKIYYIRDLCSYPVPLITDLGVQNTRGVLSRITDIDLNNFFLTDTLLYGDDQVVDLNGYSPSKKTPLENLNILAHFGIAPKYKDSVEEFPYFEEPCLQVSMIGELGEHSSLFYGRDAYDILKLIRYVPNVKKFYYRNYEITKLMGEPATIKLMKKLGLDHVFTR